MRGRVDLDALIERMFRGEVSAAARLITIIEDGGSDTEKVMERIFPEVKGSYRVGFTGPPGAGKSSIVYRLSKLFSDRKSEIGIIAVDPTSPFSGGALLGDRIRMQKLSEDPRIFIRSLASRGNLGGISNCTDEVADLLDAFGKDLILVETVGVGQSELEIAEKTHTVVIILVPESGDGIQAMKAGLMEIGDIFVMNKADHSDAELAAREIEDSLRLKSERKGAWSPPVMLTSALEGNGMEELAEKIEEHRSYLSREGLLREKRKQILRSRVRDTFVGRIEKRIWQDPSITEFIDNKMEDIYQGRLTPYMLVRELEELISLK